MIEILGLASLAHVLVEWLQGLQIQQLNRKPFNCNLCFGFWIAIIPGFVLYDIWGAPFAASVAVASEIIYKLINRL